MAPEIINKSEGHIITGLVVSAGESKRMGNFKPLLKYSNKTFLHQIISNLDVICERIIIVTGFNSELMQNETVRALKDPAHQTLFNKIIFVENTGYQKGMFTSLQKGLTEVKKLNLSLMEKSWVIYHFVDQPGLPAVFYSDFIKQIDNIHNWIQPLYKNRKGHPILLKNDLFDIILETDEQSSLRDISRKPVVKKKLWDCGYKNVLQDIDTPEDYSSGVDI
jgi:molybdenum cofactor cytidylyltransferase